MKNLNEKLKNLRVELEEMKEEYERCVTGEAEHGAYLASEEIKIIECKIEWAIKRSKERA